jgi:hypothetical protein
MDLQIVYLEPAKVILSQIGRIFVKAVIVLLILLIGWIISKAIKAVITKVLKTIKVDDLAQRINLDAFLKKGGIGLSISELIGVMCYWLGILITFLVGVNAVGLTESASLIEKLILYIPNVIAAIFILIFGMFIATLLSNVVKTTATNAGVSQTILLEKIIRAVIIAFAIAISLVQLGIAANVITLIITILLGTLGFGLALAFGLGCKDIVGKYVHEFLEDIKTKK